MKTKYLGLMTMCLLFFTIIMTSCGDAATTNEANSLPNNEPDSNSALKSEDNEAPLSETPEVRIVKHVMDETEIKGTPIRIVTLFQGATDTALALGVKPIGAVESWVQQPIYEYLRDDLQDVLIIGLETQPNLEEIAKLKPDLIIASKVRHEKIYPQLSQIAPTVTHETVFKFKETMELMGEAMNAKEQARELLAQWDERVVDFQTKIKTKLGNEWPVQISVLNFRADHARIYVSGFAGDILEELGFTVSTYQQEEKVKGTVTVNLTSKESIPNMNADVFFVFKFDDTTGDAVQKSYEEWTSHPLWNNLDAVINDQVYMVDEVFWNNGGGIIAANKMLDQVYEHFGLAQ